MRQLTARGGLVFLMLRGFQNCQGCFWEAQMFQDGYHRPEKGTEKEEMMASHEDRKQKNARYRLAWLVGGFGPIENWQILAEFSTK